MCFTRSGQRPVPGGKKGPREGKKESGERERERGGFEREREEEEEEEEARSF